MGLAVGVKNGLLGRRAGLDVSDWVLPRARAVGANVYLERGGRPSRGYLWGRKCKRHFRRWLEARAKAGDQIVLVGKSMGAHDIITAVEDTAVWDHCAGLLYDPAFTLKRFEWYSRNITCADWVTVVRQRGYRSGYRVQGAKDDHVIAGKHTTLERTKEGQRIGNEWLTEHGLPAL